MSNVRHRHPYEVRLESFLRTLDQVFPGWKKICDKYDALCESALGQCAPDQAQKKIESITWEQQALELLLTMFVHFGIEFQTSEDEVQKIASTADGVEKEIDFSITIGSQEIYFGVTSFVDSEEDFKKDVDELEMSIQDLRYPDGTVSNTAKISNVRSHRKYLSRRLAVRVATEGKHRLGKDYVYVSFPKSNQGFGGGFDAISTEFEFEEGGYTFKQNGITGLIVIGEYLKIEPKKKSIERGVLLIRTKAFDHASDPLKAILAKLDGITFNQRARNEEIRKMLKAASAKGRIPTA